MSKNTIELNEDYIFNLKKFLKSKGRKATIPDIVDYALEFTLNSLNREYLLNNGMRFISMSQSEVIEKFSGGFLEEFQHDAGFKVIFECIMKGSNPYEIIELLFKSKRNLANKSLNEETIEIVEPKLKE